MCNKCAWLNSKKVHFCLVILAFLFSSPDNGRLSIVAILVFSV